MVGNCNLFFMAAYDTTTQALNSMMINIAQYPDIQEKLAAEISFYNLDRPNVTIEELDQSMLLE